MEPRQVTKQHGIEKGIRPIKPANELSHIPWNIFEEFRRFPKVTDSIAATAQLSCIRLYLLYLLWNPDFPNPSRNCFENSENLAQPFGKRLARRTGSFRKYSFQKKLLL